VDWSTSDVVAVLFLLGLVILAVFAAPSLWRRGQMPNAPGWWPYSENFWRGLYRSLFIGSAGGVYLLVALIVAELWHAGRPPDEQGLPAPLWAQILVPGILFAFVLMMVTVILFNRPKRVVPPAFRDQDGLLTRSRRE